MVLFISRIFCIKNSEDPEKMHCSMVSDPVLPMFHKKDGKHLPGPLECLNMSQRPIQ